ncbi:MAG: multicopper oxidase family protein [Cyanobacteria bacterium J06639_14]
MTKTNRRKFLAWSIAGSVATVFSTRCAGSTLLRNLPFSIPSRNTSPSVYRSLAGLLEVSLQASQERLALGSQTANLLTYNGQVPGPRLEAKSGDTVRILLKNQLEQPTNLHFHGLHIPPTGNADNVFLMVPHGETQSYEFTIPKQHPGGLFWYHPHPHGLVAEQVFGGLAGPLIIRGEVDAIPEIQAAQEAILVLQDFDLNRWGQRREPTPLLRRLGREGNLMRVNGGSAPELTIPQAGLLRLRLLNASPSRIYRLQLENHPWHLIGLDGGTLPEPIELETDLTLAPGERADILVAGTREPNTYKLLSLPYDRGIADMMGGMEHHHTDNTRPESTAIVLARFNYGESTTAVPLPEMLLPYTPLADPTKQREFVLDHGIHKGQSFLINGRGFEHDRVDTTVQLGTVEDWRIINKAGMDHPFHIHTNAFQVLNRNGQPFPFSVWKDVVNIPAYEAVDLRIAFTDFPGKSVYHCHILDHEDQGMMGILEIQTASV